MLINCVAEKTPANGSAIMSVAFSPDGTKIVSGSYDGTIWVGSYDGTKIVSGSADNTIKVWDLGAPEPSNRPSLAKTDACWLVWQASWSC